MTTQDVTSLLGAGQTTKKYDIPIDHLDYGYIEKCSDIKELEKILKILRSGEEGVYPEMEKVCEDKIASINPNSRVLRKSQPILSTRDLEKDDQEKLTEDLSAWTDAMKTKDETLKSSTSRGPDIDESGLPPVRAAGSSVPVSKTSKNTKKNKRVKPRDYREWDKVDVEAELEKVDKTETASTISTKTTGGEPAQVTKEEIKGLTEEERMMHAEREKDKGNEEFRSGDYKQALAYYNRSLAYQPVLNSYNNRALAYVKLKLWDKAIADCNTVLGMESNNIKALLRRALSYKGKFLYTESEADLKCVLGLEPHNKRAKDLLDEVVKERMKTQQEVQSTKAPPSGQGKRMVIEETDGSSSESEEESKPPGGKPSETSKPNIAAKGQDKADALTASTGQKGKDGSTPVDKTIDLKSSLLLNGGLPDDDNDKINPNITMDVNKSKNPKGKVLIEEISTESSTPSQNGLETIPSSETVGKHNGPISVASEKDVVEVPQKRAELLQKQLPPAVDKLKAAGTELFKTGQYGDALQKYTQALSKLSSDDVVNLSLLHSNIAACKSKIGDCRGCIEASTRSLELVPHAIKPLLRRADAYEHLEKYDKAYADYRHILNMDSSVENAQRGSTRCSKELRNVNGIQWRDLLPPIPNPSLVDIPLVTMLNTSQPISSQPPPQQEPTPPVKSTEEQFDEFKTQGNELVKKSNFREAVAKYDECIRLCPDNAIPYTNRALCHLRLNKPTQARDDCNRALKLDTNNVKALFRRAQAYKVSHLATTLGGLAEVFQSFNAGEGHESYVDQANYVASEKMLKKYQDSFADLRTLLKLEPKNGAAKKEMELVLKYISQENEKAKKSKMSSNRKHRVNIKEVGSSDEDD